MSNTKNTWMLLVLLISVFLSLRNPAGGPFYPVFTGRRDSTESFYEEAMAEIPRPDDIVNQTLHLFALRGFNPRETVALLGGHNIGKIGCEFIQNRLYNFSGTGQPDPTISPDALNEMRLNCTESNNSSNDRFHAAMRSRGMGESISFHQRLSSSLSSGAGFDTHYYDSLLKGGGILFADQQLMAEENTARVVRAYASDDGSTFRADFARVMVKLSTLSVLTGSQGQIRLNCSMPVSSK
ncbi:hypothetical protein L1049_022036 [Liquidambar formosana]|uniref:peroxidase n=1 Tax=Liquidambar formosana TaxID=63359 RepID=A0AAP0RC76_LIQFO